MIGVVSRRPAPTSELGARTTFRNVARNAIAPDRAIRAAIEQPICSRESCHTTFGYRATNAGFGGAAARSAYTGVNQP